MDIHIEHVQLESVKEVDYNICSLQVVSNIFVFALRNGPIFCIDLDKPSAIHNLKIPLLDEGTSPEKLLTTWLSTDSSKLFIKTNFANYYLLDIKQLLLEQGKTQKCIFIIKKLLKKNYDIRYVQWFSPDKLLCSTYNGKIFYIDFENAIHNPKIVNCWNSRKEKPIEGILYCPDVGNLLIVEKNKLLLWKSHDTIIPLTPLELLQSEPNEIEDFKHLNQHHSQSHRDSKIRFTSLNNRIFAWTTASSVIYGDISSTNSTTNHSILNSAKILFNIELPPLIESKNRENKNLDYPIKDIILTDFHIVILRDSTITVINQINNEVQFQESIHTSKDTNQISREYFMGLTVDNYNKDGSTFWCYSNSNIYEIIINNESKAIWNLLCEQNAFDKALSLPGLNSWEKSSIELLKGSYLFDKEKDVLGAAKSFGNTNSVNIGTVALKYMNIKDNNKNEKDSAENTIEYLSALQNYLLMKLGKINKEPETESNKLPLILLSSWIIWNFMQQFNIIDELISNSAGNVDDSLTDRKNKAQSQFNEFLVNNVNSLDKPTVYQIISNQNRKYDLLFFASVINDFEYMVSYWIKQENWYESLKILLKYQNPSTVYKYSTILLVNSPDATINTWMKIKQLAPVNLLPAILTFFTNFQRKVNTNKINEKNYGLIYLIWYIEENNSSIPGLPSILYNTALYMMITTCSSTADRIQNMQEQAIISFLQTYVNKYDLNFILNLSLKTKNNKVAVHLLSELKLYDDAVSIAIKNNMIEEAKMVINKISISETTEIDQEKSKKNLWLKIAHYVLLNTSTDLLDVKQAISMLITESHGILEIRDLLVLCNKLTTIANLKDELIKSLEKHSDKMNKISNDIKRSIDLKERIRTDFKNFDKNFNIIDPGNSCDYCNKFLQSRKFIIFPCNHCYHKDCIIKLILNSNDYNLISKVQKMTKDITNGLLDKDRDELEKLLTTKCYLCSYMNINKVDDPLFINESELNKWNI